MNSRLSRLGASSGLQDHHHAEPQQGTASSGGARRGDTSFGIAPPPQNKSCIQGAGPPNSRANTGAAASSTNPNPTASQVERDPV
jgi:hypothetical protein